MTQDTFFESVYVKGHRRRWEADADWTSGPASIRSEYTWQSDDRLGQGIGDEDLPDARGQAWYVSGTWVLTGERKQRPVKAADPFAQGGIGAIEVAVRYERMWFDSTPAGEDETLAQPPRGDDFSQRRSCAHTRRQLDVEPVHQGPGQRHPGTCRGSRT